MTRQQDSSSAFALDCQARLANTGLGDNQDECVSQVVESRLLAAGARRASHNAHGAHPAHAAGAHEASRTEDALRTIAARLDRIAAAYVAALENRSNGSR